MLGCTPKERVTEQHDIFFGIANSLKELVPQMEQFWPEDKAGLHIDCWREVTSVEGYAIEVVPSVENKNNLNLFFLNLGGYKPNEFEEYHYKMLSVAEKISDSVKKSKQTAFYKHYGFKGAESHVDEKYGIDVDDMHKVSDLLDKNSFGNYSIQITEKELPEDELHIGYVKLSKLLKS